jgi:hypothetical protein
MSTVTPFTRAELPEEDYVEFWRAGAVARGVFCCIECGRTVTSVHRLPLCPGCFGQLWEEASTSPFGGGEHSSTPASRYDAWREEDRDGAARVVSSAFLALAAGPLLWLATAAWALVLFRLIAG